MPRGLSLQLASDRADLLNEAWKVGEGNRVDDVEVHRPVTVHDAIPQSNGLGPGTSGCWARRASGIWPTASPTTVRFHSRASRALRRPDDLVKEERITPHRQPEPLP